MLGHLLVVVGAGSAYSKGIERGVVMAVYTHLSDEEIAALLEQYGIGELRLAMGIAQGVENSNYLIEAQRRGEVSHKYILTLYEKRVNPEDLPFFIGLMEHLASRGVPCPLPVHARSGEVIVEAKGRPAAIVSFLNGRSRSIIRGEFLGSLGMHIAQLHEAADGFVLRRANDLSLEGWWRIFRKIHTQLNSVQDGLEDAVHRELDYLSAHWPDTLPLGIIHADLFPDNVFFDGTQVSGIIDFYFACEDMLAYELAICLNCWCFEPSGEFNMTKAQTLLRAYDKQRSLSQAERMALPLLARGAALRFLLTRAHDWIHHPEGALVTPKNPLEYYHKLRFHQQVVSVAEYGL